MRALRISLLTLSLALLSGCSAISGNDASDASKHGHYSGIGIYSPGKLWTELKPTDNEAKQDPNRATRSDDDQIIVVVDSKTGEVRECGNYSGYCTSIQPWTSAVSSAPVELSKHADAVDGNAANAAADAPDTNAASH